jgi:hypothetical protein
VAASDARIAIVKQERSQMLCGLGARCVMSGTTLRALGWATCRGAKWSRSPRGPATLVHHCLEVERSWQQEKKVIDNTLAAMTLMVFLSLHLFLQTEPSTRENCISKQTH